MKHRLAACGLRLAASPRMPASNVRPAVHKIVSASSASSVATVCLAVLLAAAPVVMTQSMLVADAAKSGDAAAVRALLKQGVDVNAAQGDGMTALHWAATNGDVAITQMLLSAGANVRATTRLGGLTPLHLATQAGQPQVAAALIAAGAGPNLATATGATPLMLAAR